MTGPAGIIARMRRPTAVLAGVAVVVVVVAAAVAWWALRDDRGATDADRAALAEALASGTTDPDVAAAGVARLAGDADRWARLVADGGDDLVALLDRGVPALGADDRARAAAVAGPLADGSTVADDVAPALGRWAWPLLAGPDPDDATTVDLLARGTADDADPAVLAGLSVARAHVLATTVRPDDLRDWSHRLQDVVTAAGGGSVAPLLSAANGATLREATAAAVLARFAATSDGAASAPLADALDAWSVRVLDRTDHVAVDGRALMAVASVLGAIDDRDDTTAAAALAAVVAEARDRPTSDRASAVYAVDDAILNLPEVRDSESVAFEAVAVVRGA